MKLKRLVRGAGLAATAGWTDEGFAHAFLPPPRLPCCSPHLGRACAPLHGGCSISANIYHICVSRPHRRSYQGCRGLRASVSVEGESPTLLAADVSGLTPQAAVAWIHAWCSQAIPAAPTKDTTDNRKGGKAPDTKPGLPSTCLPIHPTLTSQGARLVCSGLGPAFLDIDAVPAHGPTGCSIVVRRSMPDDQLARHSLSIRGLARDTEKAVVAKLRLDLAHTKLRGGGPLSVRFSKAAPAAPPAVLGPDSRPKQPELASHAEAPLPQQHNTPPPPPSSSSTTPPPPPPPPSATPDPPAYSSSSAATAAAAAGPVDVEDLSSANSRAKDAIPSEEAEEEDDGPSILDGLNLDELEAELAKPDSPFAQQAAEAYEVFLKQQQQQDGTATGPGMKELVLEGLQEMAATPDDVKAMFESGMQSVMKLHDNVAEKAKLRKRRMDAVKQTASSATSTTPSTDKGPREQEVHGLVTLQMMLEGAGLKGGIDIMAGPPGEKPIEFPSLDEMVARGDAYDPSAVMRERTPQEVVDDAEEAMWEEEDDDDDEDAPADPMTDYIWDVATRFDLLLQELEAAEDEMFANIASQYYNVFLSRHFIALMRGRMQEELSDRQHTILLRMVNFAEQLVVQLQEMSQLYEMQQLDKIRGICDVAQNDMNKLSDYVASRREELDEDFVKYLHYLMEVERQKIKDSGVGNPDREPSNWLMILEIIKKGVYHELAKTIKNDVSMIHFITRFDEEDERDYLARSHIDRLLPSQVVPFKRVVTQMVDHFESRVHTLTDQELQLAERVLQVEDILEEMYPDSSLLSLLQTEEGRVGMDAVIARTEALLHDPREWDHSAVEGLWDPEYLAAKYDRILQHYGFTASRAEGVVGVDRVANAGGEGRVVDPKRRLVEEAVPVGGALPGAIARERREEDAPVPL